MARKRVNKEIGNLPIPTAPVVRADLPLIPLDSFLVISGKKYDQLAGFKAYAKLNNLGPLTVPAWQDAFNAFLNKPTN